MSEVQLAHVEGCADFGEAYCNYCCITVAQLQEQLDATESSRQRVSHVTMEFREQLVAVREQRDALRKAASRYRENTRTQDQWINSGASAIALDAAIAAILSGTTP